MGALDVVTWFCPAYLFSKVVPTPLYVLRIAPPLPLSSKVTPPHCARHPLCLLLTSPRASLPISHLPPPPPLSLL